MDYLEAILRTFPIDTGSTRRLQLDGLRQGTKLYSVDADSSPLIESIDASLYIIDTSAGQEIACHPHIVSERLAELCIEAASEFAFILRKLNLISSQSGILHILRGSSGYKVDEALPELPVVHIRTKYSQDGYRAHSDDSRRIDVTYSDYHRAKFDTLIIPDTYATGRSVEAALKHMFDEGLNVEKAVIYGYAAVPAIERVYGLLVEHDVELHVFAICDISQLYSNNYDMPLYGLDEHIYRQEAAIRRLGSIVSLETLREMIPHYIPGLDQPGDWSERHNELFNGYSNENGDIKGHLQKSIELIKSLDELNSQQPWSTESNHVQAQREIEKCRELL